MILSGKDEINESVRERVIMTCRCSGCDGQLVAEWWDEDTEDFFISFKANRSTFWRRVRSGLKYIFNFSDLCEGEITTTRKEAKKFIENLKKFS